MGGSGAGPSHLSEVRQQQPLLLCWTCECVIAIREDTEEFKLKLSDVYFTLGEVALESGIQNNYFECRLRSVCVRVCVCVCVCMCVCVCVCVCADQIDQAVCDMNAGLQLKELLLEPHDRRLAEALVL